MFTRLAKILSCDIDEGNLPLRAEQIRARLRSYPLLIAGQVLIVLLLVVLMWDKVAHNVLLAWAGVLLAALGVEIYYVRRNAAATRNLAECRLWRTRLIGFVIILGTIWGAGGIVLFVQDDLAYQALLICVFLGVAAGAATTNPVFPPALTIFISLLIVPLLLINLAVGDSTHVILSAMLGVFLAHLLNTGRSLARTFELAMCRTFENGQLVSQLTEEKQSAEQANRMKSRFLAAASHDLRQPIHALTLYVESLKTHVQGVQGGALHGKVAHSVEVLGSMLDVLLDVSRLDGGIIQPSYEHFPMQPLLNTLYQDFSALAQEKGLHLEVMACDEHVFSDRVLLERVLRNLLNNALYHTEQGTISLISKPVAQGVELTVHDTGSGITPEHLPHIFEDYYQIGNQHRDRRKGLGMGLAIVKRLNQLLGYQLQVSSTPGAGSCFVMVVPQRRQEQSPVRLWSA